MGYVYEGSVVYTAGNVSYVLCQHIQCATYA